MLRSAKARLRSGTHLRVAPGADLRCPCSGGSAAKALWCRVQGRGFDPGRGGSFSDGG